MSVDFMFDTKGFLCLRADSEETADILTKLLHVFKCEISVKCGWNLTQLASVNIKGTKVLKQWHISQSSALFFFFLAESTLNMFKLTFFC